jgi:hypothetical protein
MIAQLLVILLLLFVLVHIRFLAIAFLIGVLLAMLLS